MADFRFKIQGTASPFLIQLSAGTTHVCETVFEYSGGTSNIFDPLNAYTCAMLSSLVQNTVYNMTITDSVGNTYPTGSTPFSFTTATSPYPEPIPVKNINLLGVVSNPTTCVQTLGAPKQIEVTPPLSTGECLGLTFSASTENGNTDTAAIDIYKRCGLSGAYVANAQVSNNSCCNVIINIGADDSICYDMSAIVDHPSSGVQCYSYACANLELMNATISGSTATLSCGPVTDLTVEQTCCTTTTTTTTTGTPIEVYWNTPSVFGTLERVVFAKLCTNPQLEAGQSFRLHLYNKAYFCFDTILGGLVCAKAYGTEATIPFGCAEIETFDPSNPKVGVCIVDDSYVDVNCDNICSISGNLLAHDDIANSSVNHVIYSCSQINQISNAVGGNYSISGTIPAGASRNIVACVCSSGS